MKLLRFGERGHERPGVCLPDGRRKDLSGCFHDWDREFFAGDGRQRLAALLARSADSLPDVPAEARIAPPVARPGKVVAIGLNYADHAAESGQPVPSRPVVFCKAANCVCGAQDPLIIPRHSQQTDWEAELGLVIGREARYLPDLPAAAAAIAGYCTVNDVSEREFQRFSHWFEGKSGDNFCPLGPWLATPDEVPDPQRLAVHCRVNGELMQHSSTSQMVFSAVYLVHYLSQYFTLEPGDLITTGTPPGVGAGRKPPRFLRAGDRVEIEVEGLGCIRQLCVDAS